MGSYPFFKIRSNQPQEEPSSEPEVEVASEKEHYIILFNDDVNTFQHVIETLVRVCDHTYEQAEQCAYIVHFKGKCTVKNGDFDTLKDMRNAICGAGISAEVK